MHIQALLQCDRLLISQSRSNTAAMGGAGWEGEGCHIERSPGCSFNDVFAALLLIPGQMLIDYFNLHTNTTCAGLQMSHNTRQCPPSPLQSRSPRAERGCGTDPDTQQLCLESDAFWMFCLNKLYETFGCTLNDCVTSAKKKNLLALMLHVASC